MESFRTLGVMLDCSRNAVLRPEELYRFIDILAKMGYNTIQLYTEDTYEIDGSHTSAICVAAIRRTSFARWMLTPPSAGWSCSPAFRRLPT